MKKVYQLTILHQNLFNNGIIGGADDFLTKKGVEIIGGYGNTDMTVLYTKDVSLIHEEWIEISEAPKDFLNRIR